MKHANVLILSGHDPSGGAGLQADIEAVAAYGAHGVSVITALTQQDTRNVSAVQPVDTEFFTACINTLYEDMDFDAIKTGVLASVEQVEAVAELAAKLPDTPLVVDPVLTAAGGGELAADPVGQASRDLLFSRAAVITPNAGEARRLCGNETDLDRCGATLATLGCHALLTGGDEDNDVVLNRLYHPDGRIKQYEWPRLAGRFHGSGCTLAAAIAARLAGGKPLEQAVADAQEYTWQALASGYTAGRGQAIPNRLPGEIS